jgi:hypothetical protein
VATRSSRCRRPARQANADPDDQIGGVVKPGSAVEGCAEDLLVRRSHPSTPANSSMARALAYEMIVTAFASGDKARFSRCSMKRSIKALSGHRRAQRGR